MAMQTGVSSSKVIVMIGAGLTGSIILRNGRLSDVLAELQELVKGINEVEVTSTRYDTSLLAAQIRNLAQEVRELTLSRPVAIFNGNSTSNGNLASYIMPAAAVGAMGYCYMWWKGWSFSDVMFVTKRNMANAVANVSKQLDQASAILAATKKHLSQRLEGLDGKVDQQKEISKLIMNEVSEVKSDLSQIGFDIESIQKMVYGLEGKMGLLENKQDETNTGLWYLCQIAGGIKDGLNAKLFQEATTKFQSTDSSLTFTEDKLVKSMEATTKFQSTDSSLTFTEDKLVKGLRFLAESPSPRELEESKVNSLASKGVVEKSEIITSSKITTIHRSYPKGISFTNPGLALKSEY